MCTLRFVQCTETSLLSPGLEGTRRVAGAVPAPGDAMDGTHKQQRYWTVTGMEASRRRMERVHACSKKKRKQRTKENCKTKPNKTKQKVRQNKLKKNTHDAYTAVKLISNVQVR